MGSMQYVVFKVEIGKMKIAALFLYRLWGYASDCE